jgi:hypothetical protein
MNALSVAAHGLNPKQNVHSHGKENLIRMQKEYSSTYPPEITTDHDNISHIRARI